MLKTYVRFQNWMATDEGATAVEYGLMVALIAVVIIGAVTAIGTALTGKFWSVSGSLGGPSGP
jgi:pilus assembly protein Flp/PilA